MKKCGLILIFITGGLLINIYSDAQCSICTKTAQQLGDGPAKGLNNGILLLAFTPFAIAGYISFKWWKNNRKQT